MQACDKDCRLGSAVPLSKFCSKPCGGGFRRYKRKIAVKALGNGKCPPPGQKFYSERSCNPFDCKSLAIKTNKDGLILCHPSMNQTSKIIFLLDASGSVRAHNWKRQVKLTIKLREALPQHMLVSVGRFSGCGRLWIVFKKWRNDMKKTIADLKALFYKRGCTPTGVALRRARAHFAKSLHPKLKPHIVMVTDGYPSKSWMARTEARRTRAMGVRLTVMTVTRRSWLRRMAWQWASHAKKDNVFNINRYRDIDSVANCLKVANALTKTICGDRVARR